MLQQIEEEQGKSASTRSRHMGLEYLRVIAAYMIVWIHAWSMEVDANAVDIFAAAIVYSLVQVAVPVFVFLSGAFLIPNERNQHAIRFWKKVLLNYSLFHSVSSCWRFSGLVQLLSRKN